MSSTPPPPKPRPYRRFLTSTLHARFVQSTCWAFLASYAIAFLTSDWYTGLRSFLWALFPLGSTGIKAGLFCLSSVFVLILQIGSLRVGTRTSPSRLASIRSGLFSALTCATIFWYLVSAWWFCEVFVFTSSYRDELSWVIKGGYGAPDRVNERPIYLRVFFLVLGCIQAFWHLTNSWSWLPLENTVPKSSREATADTHRSVSLSTDISARAREMTQRAVTSSGVATIIGPFLYTMLFRQPFWNVHVSIAKAFANITRADARPPSGFYVGSVMLKAFFFGVFLCMAWELNIVLFRAYMLQEPVTNGLPLSASAKDPNGTLINGLNAKRDLVKTFAFWELVVIAHKMPERRRAIFADFDRVTGPAFTSMLNAAISTIASIDQRIAALNAPSAPAPIPAVQAAVETSTLPRILPASKTMQNTIFATSPSGGTLDRLSQFVSSEAQVLGSSPKPWSPPVQETTQRLLEYTKPGFEELQRQNTAVAQSLMGRYLLATPSRTINSVILGEPISNAAVIVDAIEASTKLLVSSLQEDMYGKAVTCVPPTVTQFTRTINAIETYVRQTTGGIGNEGDILDVVNIQRRLKFGLTELLSAFHHFLNDIGLSIKDLNEAHKAAEERPLLRSASPPQQRASQRQPEMEEPARRQNERRPEPERRRSKQNENSTRDRSNTADRPGRLFRHLDPDYVEKNQRIESKPNSGVNVLGARDLGSNAGGISRRRAVEVR